MTLLAYPDAWKTSLLVQLPEGEAIRVISIPALAILKLVAWRERRLTTRGKDAEDLWLLLRNYLEAGQMDRLAWVERGLELYRKGNGKGLEGLRLDGLRRELLMKVGRREEAIQSAWGYFRSFPHRSTYLELLAYVPKVEAKAWRERALGVIDQASLNTRFEQLLALREGGRLAQVVRETPDAAMEDLSHTLTEPAALRLQKPHPELGGRLWLAQAMRIVKGKRSRYYDEAVIAFSCPKISDN